MAIARQTSTIARQPVVPAKPRWRRALGAPRWLLGLIVPVALLGLWQWLVAREVYTRSQLPAPKDVWLGAEQLWTADLLLEHITISIGRVAQGFAWGAGIAVLLGLAVGLSPLIDALLSPTIQAVRAIPSLAWVPLLILWMGIGDQPKITLVAIGVFFPVFTAFVGGIQQIDRKLVEVGHAYGLRGPVLAWQILLPAATPSLLTGLRIGLAQGWLFLVAAELIGASRGLGFLLTDGQNTGRADIIVLSIVLLALLGKGTDVLLGIAQRRALRWSDAWQA
ncbi:MAG TPA: ABC transporter permease [Thermomicrobiales bacterium]|nr:ABC transporter permease [Thermomicrobiales bacterium]